MRIFGELATAEQVSEIKPDPEKLFAAPGDRVGDDPRYGLR